MSNTPNNATWIDSTDFQNLKDSFNDFFLIINGVILSVLQCGLACLEAGYVKPKNVANIIFKNIMDMFLCCIIYWLIGYSLAYSDGNQYFGYKWWAGIGVPENSTAHWFFQFIFAATAATIISGAVAERCNPIAYVVYCIYISGFVYPIVSHWVWAPGGWLSEIGYSDFSGAGPVHLLAGTASFIAAYFIGPRLGVSFKRLEIPCAQSPKLAGIGTLLLIFGFLAFNGGSLGHIAEKGDGVNIAKVIINTILGGSGGSIVMLILGRIGAFGEVFWPYTLTINGLIAGMVSICGSPNLYTQLEALTVGAIGCFVYLVVRYAVFWAKVDDALDATAVHFGGGLWGVIAVGIFSKNGIIYNVPRGLETLKLNSFGALAIIIWAVVWSSLLFRILNLFGVLRVSQEDEINGLDMTQHKEETEGSMEVTINRANQNNLFKGIDNMAIQLDETTYEKQNS